jgi:hypothetical protein
MRSAVQDKSRRLLLNDFGHASGMVGDRRLRYSLSHLDRAGLECRKSRDCSAGNCPLRCPLALYCFIPCGRAPLDTLAIAAGLFGFLLDVSIRALFFCAPTAHRLLLGYCTRLARMEHLCRPRRCHVPASEQNLCQALCHGQPRTGAGILLLLSRPWRRCSRHACLP